jgi:hypothetical protein
MGNSQVFRSFEIGDGTGYLKDAIVGAGRETLLLHGAFQQTLRVGTELAMNADLAGRHLCVGIDFLAKLLETLALALSSCHDSGADLG